MERYKEITGDLIKLALTGTFEVIAHGTNCLCAQKNGLAPQMVKAFQTDEYHLEQPVFKGDVNKLGQIEYRARYLNHNVIRSIAGSVIVVNCYTQFGYRTSTDPYPLDYEALTLCMRKLNSEFKGRHIGLPQIGAGLAGGDWERIKEIIQKELTDCFVTVVIYQL